MSLIQISDLSFTYPGQYDPVFEHLTLRFDTNWKLGLVGRNGYGKTTLLRLLLGEYEYVGHIVCAARFRCFPAAAPAAGQTVAQAAAACRAPQWRFARELGLLGLGPEVMDRPFDSLSFGEQTRVQLAMLFAEPEGYPLIDEPTNHLDAAGRAMLGARLRRRENGFLLVSHDRALLDESCDHILALERSGASVRQGNYTSWRREVADRDARELAENQRLHREIARLKEAEARASRWADKAENAKFNARPGGLRPDRGYQGHIAAKGMKRTKAIQARREQAVADTQALLHDLEYAEPLKMTPLPCRVPRLVQARDLCLCPGGRVLGPPLRFELHPGDRLALTGGNGCGKTSLLRLVCGEEVGHTGLLETAGGLRISYVPQSAGALQGTPVAYAQARGVDVTRFLTILRKFGFARTQFEKTADALSEGQKKKLLLAASLCESAHLYVWDEPLNYLDLYAREQLEQLLLRYGPTLLFVEHDRMFCQNVATATLPLDES